MIHNNLLVYNKNRNSNKIVAAFTYFNRFFSLSEERKRGSHCVQCDGFVFDYFVFVRECLAVVIRSLFLRSLSKFIVVVYRNKSHNQLTTVRTPERVHTSA